jgi:hypothetical protein
VKLDARAFITDADVFRRGACDRYILTAKPGLLPEYAARSALASQAVTNGNAHGLASHPSRKLAAAARGKAIRHM